MVGEFPELQGIMGGYYARAQGEEPQVADAIRDHYKPVGQGDDVPTAPVTVAVSLADKLDTLVGFFAFDMQPTGSKDPFALRRAAIGILRLLLANQVRLKLGSLLSQEYMMSILAHSIRQVEEDVRRDLQALDPLPETHTTENAMAIVQARREALLSVGRLEQFLRSASDIVPFLIDRLKVQQREAGVWHDLIDAVFALGGEDDLVRLLARVKALQAFVGTEDGVNLLAGYKRAANILKSSPERGGGGVADGGVGLDSAHSLTVPSASTGPSTASGPPPRSGEDVAELALHTALDTAEPLAAAAIEAEDFASAMTALASLRAPIDAFFEGVMVNDPDPDKRAYRLGLLTRFRDAVHRVADFSKIEG
jgi:glycyl-tRNA synthetase beta chain